MLALGVLHHLDDDEAGTLIDCAYKALKPGGRFVSADACRVKGQNPIARFLIDRDRGQNVRDESGYNRLIKARFSQARVLIRHQSWIPYTSCITVSQR